MNNVDILQSIALIVVGAAVIVLATALRDLAKAVMLLAELHEDEEA